MFFIGVISEKQKFETLKNSIKKDMNKSEITLININKKSIDNLKSVRFDVIVILNSLEKILDEDIVLNKICENVKYFLINSDIDIKTSIFSNIKTNVITFGLNQKSTVTYSSITDETLLISVQREFKNNKQQTIELGEYDVKICKEDRTKLHEILVKFIMEKLYS